MLRSVILTILVSELFGMTLSLAQNPSYPIDGKYFRGIHVADDQSVWMAGSNGVLMHFWIHQDSIQLLDSTIIKDSLELRDVHAFNDQHILALSVTKPAAIYMTRDGCKSWEVTLEVPGGFLDGITFEGGHGFVYGDPLNDTLLVYETMDSGATWTKHSSEHLVPHEGEAGFAASGSGLIIQDGQFMFGTGGGRTALYLFENGLWEIDTVPMRSGEACGIYSMDIDPLGRVVCVGGNYLEPDNRSGNYAVRDPLKTWLETDSTKAPTGYRCCVCHVQDDIWVSTGRNGTDVSRDGGISWSTLADTPGNVVTVVCNHLLIVSRDRGLVCLPLAQLLGVSEN